MNVKLYYKVLKITLILGLCSFNKPLHSQTTAKLVLPIGHSNLIKSAIFSPNGKQIVTTSYTDFTAKVWDVKTGKLIHSLEGNTNAISSAKYSFNGKQILTTSYDGVPKLWDAESGSLLKDIKYDSMRFYSAYFVPLKDDIIALKSSDDKIVFLRMSTGNKLIGIEEVHNNNSFYDMSLDSSGTRLVTTSDENIDNAKIWDVETGKLLINLKGHSKGVVSAVFSPNGKLVLTISRDSTVKLWDTEIGAIKANFQFANTPITTATFSRKGDKVIGSSYRDGTILIWDTKSGKKLRTITGHSQGIIAIVQNPKSSEFLSISLDSTVKIWDLESGYLKKTIDLRGLNPSFEMIGNTYASFSLDGNYIAINAFNSKVIILDNNTGQILGKLHTPSNSVYALNFHPTTNQVAISSNDKAVIWDITSGVVVSNFTGHKDRLTGVNFDKDGKYLLTASYDKTARIWNVATGKIIQTFKGHNKSLYSAEFNNEYSSVVTASFDSTAIVWNVKSGRMEQRFVHQQPVIHAVFNPNSKQLLTTSEWKIANIWDIDGNKTIKQFKSNYFGFRKAIFFANGKKVLTAGSFLESSIKIWDVQSGEIENNIQCSDYQGLTSIKFSKNENFIVVGSSSGSVILLDAQSGEVLQNFYGHTNVVSDVAISPDNQWLISGSLDGTTKVWNLRTGKLMYTRLQLQNLDWLAYDEHYRFTGSEGGISQLYLVCGLEIIDLNQLKDSLYVPDLIQQVMSGAPEILLNDKPVAKLENLNICELTPVVETQQIEASNLKQFEILPRKGGLGNIELYINGNLTYSYHKDQLKRQKNKEGKTVYILELNTDTLQCYAIGEKGTKNEILIKPLIASGGIYGRGAGSYIEKTSTESTPKFIGVFIGVNDYNNPEKTYNVNYYSNLDYAEKDANDLANAVEISAKALFKDSVQIYTITAQRNRAATKKEIENVFAEIATKAKSSDLLYIFFAGHGDIPKIAANKESEVRFMLHQSSKNNPMSSSFGMSELRVWLNPQKIKAQKRVFVFDACHSGKVIDDFNKYAFRGNKDDAWRQKQLDKLKDQSGLLILAAAADNESSYEDQQLKHGVLTYHLLKELKETASDTEVVLLHWFQKSKQDVEQYVVRKYGLSDQLNTAPVQSPKIFGSGDFALGVTNNQVRQSIELAQIKTMLGVIQFTDATGSILAKQPEMTKLIHQEVGKRLDANKIEFNPAADNSQIGYTIRSGTMVWLKGSSIITYSVYYKGQFVKSVVVPKFKTKNTAEIAIKIGESIEQLFKEMGVL